MSTSPTRWKATRRSLLDYVIGACSTVFGAAMVLPALTYLWPISKKGPTKTREEVGDDAAWNTWQARKVSVASQPVLVIKTDRGYLAFSAICTHLGCLVEFDVVKHNIHCPCHAASFDLEGRVTGGPPPKPLPTYRVSVTEGKVYVSL